MDSLTLEQKQAQFNEFFLIGHALKVNVRTLASDFVLPEPEQLEEHMPYAFRIASEMSAIETQALRPLRNLSSHASDLVNYLTHQSRKIDLMMSYILHQQDDLFEQFADTCDRRIFLRLAENELGQMRHS